MATPTRDPANELERITLRYQEVADAERFYEILNHPSFVHFDVKPKSVEAEVEWLAKNEEKKQRNFEHNYAIVLDGKVIGACGMKIDQHRMYIGEIGYFLDNAYWGRGITTQAVKLLERLGFETLGLSRIEIIMHPENKASEGVAINCGYAKEGMMRRSILENGVPVDALLYAKTK